MRISDWSSDVCSSDLPEQIAMIKGLVAGAVNLLIGLLWRGDDLPATGPLLVTLLLGFLGYGISLVLFIYALRYLGSARTGAYFSTAPFIGAVVAIAIRSEEHTSELQSLMRISYAVFCLKKKKQKKNTTK